MRADDPCAGLCLAIEGGTGLHRASDREEGSEQARDAAIAHDLLSVTRLCPTAAPKQGGGIDVAQAFVEMPTRTPARLVSSSQS